MQVSLFLNYSFHGLYLFLVLLNVPFLHSTNYLCLGLSEGSS